MREDRRKEQAEDTAGLDPKRSFDQTTTPLTKAVTTFDLLRREYSGSVAWPSSCDLLADVQEMVRESENGWVTRRLHDQLKHGLRK